MAQLPLCKIKKYFWPFFGLFSIWQNFEPTLQQRGIIVVHNVAIRSHWIYGH